MNPNVNLVELKRKLRGLEPNDPHTLMLRAVLHHEVDTRFMEWRAELKALGVREFEIDSAGRHVRFTPMLKHDQLDELMLKYWERAGTVLPLQLPPKFWGLHYP